MRMAQVGITTEAMQTVESRLIALEIKASFNEDLLDQLNAVIVRQQQEIALLQRDVRELRTQTARAGLDSDGAPPRKASDELPPHY
jgi:SlyX protein